MPDKPARVLFICQYHEALRSTVAPLGLALRSRGDVVPYVFAEKDPQGRIRDMCRLAGIPCRGGSWRSGAVPAAATKGVRRKQRGASGIRWLTGVVGQLVTIAAKLHRCASVLRSLRPSVLVVLDDRTVHACRWIRAAQWMGIPVVTIQWAATHRQEALVGLRIAQQQGRPASGLGRRLEDVVARLIPHATRQRAGQRVWWMSPQQTLAYWMVGAFPKTNPWAFGGGNSGTVAVFGQAWKERAVADGVAAEKLMVTGHPEQDTWYHHASQWSAEHAQAVLRELGLAPDCRIVTVMAPALCFRRPGGNREGDISMESLVEDLKFVVEAVYQLGRPYVPVVKVHPRDQVEDLAAVIASSREPVPVIRDYDVQRLVAASDAMLCQWSTTAMLGQALRVPVLVFDFHDSPSADLWKETGAFTPATTHEAFQRSLRQSLLDSDWRHEYLRRRDEFVKHFLCLDGGATERLAALIRQRAGLPAKMEQRKAA